MSKRKSNRTKNAEEIRQLKLLKCFWNSFVNLLHVSAGIVCILHMCASLEGGSTSFQLCQGYRLEFILSCFLFIFVQEIVSSVSLVYNTPDKVSVTVKANCG